MNEAPHHEASCLWGGWSLVMFWVLWASVGDTCVTSCPRAPSLHTGSALPLLPMQFSLPLHCGYFEGAHGDGSPVDLLPLGGGRTL